MTCRTPSSSTSSPSLRDLAEWTTSTIFSRSRGLLANRERLARWKPSPAPVTTGPRRLVGRRLPAASNYKDHTAKKKNCSRLISYSLSGEGEGDLPEGFGAAASDPRDRVCLGNTRPTLNVRFNDCVEIICGAARGLLSTWDSSDR